MDKESAYPAYMPFIEKCMKILQKFNHDSQLLPFTFNARPCRYEGIYITSSWRHKYLQLFRGIDQCSERLLLD